LLLLLPLTDTCCILWSSSAGKSALHWAAAVNNVEAAVVLLKNGANKDMQNNKVGVSWADVGKGRTISGESVRG